MFHLSLLLVPFPYLFYVSLSLLTSTAHELLVQDVSFPPEVPTRDLPEVVVEHGRYHVGYSGTSSRTRVSGERRHPKNRIVQKQGCWGR